MHRHMMKMLVLAEVGIRKYFLFNEGSSVVKLLNKWESGEKVPCKYIHANGVKL